MFVRYESTTGNLTSKVRQDFLEQRLKSSRATRADLQDSKVIGLAASMDQNDPIYFWQLHSVLGEGRIRVTVQAF